MKKINNFEIMIGIICLLSGAFILFRKEWNNMNNYLFLKKAVNEIKEVNSTAIYEEDNNKNVLVSGNLIVEPDELVDEETNVKIKSIKMIRKVETYQWNEVYLDNGDINYEKIWEEGILDSSFFTDAENHQNIENNTYVSLEKIADLVKIDNYIIDWSILQTVEMNQILTVLPTDIILKDGFSIQQQYITNSKDLETPEIGDVRISYEYAYMPNLTILGRQVDNGYIVDYYNDNNIFETQIKEGTYSLSDFFAIDSFKGDKEIWITRIVSICFIGIGIFFILSKIMKSENINKLIISFSLSILLSLLIIAVSWFKASVLFFVILLFVVAIMTFLITLNLKKYF